MATDISTRVSIRWLPDDASEPTDTLVYTVGAYFVDLRVLKEDGSIEWGFAGTREVVEREPCMCTLFFRLSFGLYLFVFILLGFEEKLRDSFGLGWIGLDCEPGLGKGVLVWVVIFISFCFGYSCLLCGGSVWIWFVLIYLFHNLSQARVRISVYIPPLPYAIHIQLSISSIYLSPLPTPFHD
jgi:hypothetical protein